MLFSAYRRDEFADPEGFILQVGVVLEAYSDAVIVAVTSPRTGIQRRLKWPPSIAELVQACEDEAAHRATVARYASVSRVSRRNFPLLEYEKSPGCRANVFYPASSPAYEAAVAWAQTADSADWKWDPQGRPGIWVNWLMFLDRSIGGFTTPRAAVQEAAA